MKIVRKILELAAEGREIYIESDGEGGVKIMMVSTKRAPNTITTRRKAQVTIEKDLLELDDENLALMVKSQIDLLSRETQ